MEPLYHGHAAMRGQVGVVIPAWFAPDVPVDDAARLLLTTLADSPACLSPLHVAVVVDDSEVARRAAALAREQLAREWGEPFGVLDLTQNRGKGGAVMAGTELLLGRYPGLRWIGVRDADGDHLIDDLPHLFRAGEQLAAEYPQRPATVIGSRASVHAPLGWLRGEYELLLNEVLVEAVAYALGHRGEVWDTRFLIRRAPDLQSGYKLYSRPAAERAAAALDGVAATHPQLPLQRTGMEVVPFVSLALAGGLFAEVERKAYYDQPVTSYGDIDFSRFYGTKLAWTLQTCGLPVPAAALLFDGAAVRRPLFTDPAGRAGILALRRYVLDYLTAGSLSPDVAAEPRARRFL